MSEDLAALNDAINAVVETLEDQLHDKNATESLFIIEATVRYLRSLRAVILAEQERTSGDG